MGDRSQQIVNVAQAGKDFVSMVKPQVVNSTNSATAGDNATADQMIQQLLGKANGGDDQYKALIDSIMQRAAISFAPILGEQASSGGYNATATKQLAGESTARATSESMQAIQNAKAEAARTAASLQTAKMQANQTHQQVTQPPFSVGQLLKSIGIGYAVNKGIKSLSGVKLPFGSQETAAASDAGGLPGAANGNYADAGSGDFGFYSGSGSSDVAGGVGGAGETTSFANTGFASGSQLTADEVSQILSGAGNATLSNSASLASLTDSSVTGSAADLAPAAYGDFGTVVTDPTSGATVTGAAGDGAITGTAIGDSSATGATGAGTSDVLSTTSSETALGGSATTAGGIDSAAAIDAGAEFGGGASAAGGAGEAVGGSGAALAIPIYVGANVADGVLFGTGNGDHGLVGDVFGGGGAVSDIAQAGGDLVSNTSKAIGNLFSGGGDSVICAELVRQSIMSDSTRRYNRVWAHKNINKTALKGYLEGWGPLFVRYMRKSQGATAAGNKVLSSWSQWIRGDRTAILGAAFIPVVWLPSWILGAALEAVEWMEEVSKVTGE